MNFVVSPEYLINRAVSCNLLTVEEAKTEKVKRAFTEACYEVTIGWPEGEGFGSSDGTFVMESALNIAGIATEWGGKYKSTLVRKGGA